MLLFSSLSQLLQHFSVSRLVWFRPLSAFALLHCVRATFCPFHIVQIHSEIRRFLFCVSIWPYSMYILTSELHMAMMWLPWDELWVCFDCNSTAGLGRLGSRVHLASGQFNRITITHSGRTEHPWRWGVGAGWGTEGGNGFLDTCFRLESLWDSEPLLAVNTPH